MKKYKDWAEERAKEWINSIMHNKPIDFNTPPKPKKLVDTILYRVHKKSDTYFISPRKKNKYEDYDHIKNIISGILNLADDGIFTVKIDYYITADNILSSSITRIN